MVYGDLQFFDIIIFALIAVFVVFRLRSVLGKRTGFQKSNSQESFKQENIKPEQKNIPVLKESEKKFELVYKMTNSFDHKLFLEGAKKAFEIIITSFNNGDKKGLKELVSKDVFSAFDNAINSGSNNPKSQFYSIMVDSIEDANVDNGLITISVNFISEQIINDNEEEIIKNKDTWVLEKRIDTNEPAWILIST